MDWADEELDELLSGGALKGFVPRELVHQSMPSLILSILSESASKSIKWLFIGLLILIACILLIIFFDSIATPPPPHYSDPWPFH